MSYDYGECDEIAESLVAHGVQEPPPAFADFHECAAWVRLRMPEATETVKDNVAESVFFLQRDALRRGYKPSQVTQ